MVVEAVSVQQVGGDDQLAYKLRCAQCQGYVIAHVSSDTYGTRYPKFLDRRCTECGNPPRKTILHPHYYYATEMDDTTLWACNEEHLQALIDYVEDPANIERIPLVWRPWMAKLSTTWTHPDNAARILKLLRRAQATQ